MADPIPNRKPSLVPEFDTTVLVPDHVRVGVAPVEGMIVLDMVGADEVYRFGIFQVSALQLALDIVSASAFLNDWRDRPRDDDA